MKKYAKEIKKNVFKVFYKWELLDYICGCIACIIALLLIHAIYGV